MDVGVVIKVNYGRVPHFYKHCHKLGHLQAKCLAKDSSADVVVSSEVPSRNDHLSYVPSEIIRHNRLSGYNHEKSWQKPAVRRRKNQIPHEGNRNHYSVRGRGGNRGRAQGGRGDFRYSTNFYNPAIDTPGTSQEYIDISNGFVVLATDDIVEEEGYSTKANTEKDDMESLLDNVNDVRNSSEILTAGLLSPFWRKTLILHTMSMPYP